MFKSLMKHKLARTPDLKSDNRPSASLLFYGSLWVAIWEAELRTQLALQALMRSSGLSVALQSSALTNLPFLRHSFFCTCPDHAFASLADNSTSTDTELPSESSK